MAYYVTLGNYYESQRFGTFQAQKDPTPPVPKAPNTCKEAVEQELRRFGSVNDHKVLQEVAALLDNEFKIVDHVKTIVGHHSRDDAYIGLVVEIRGIGYIFNAQRRDTILVFTRGADGKTIASEPLSAAGVLAYVKSHKGTPGHVEYNWDDGRDSGDEMGFDLFG